MSYTKSAGCLLVVVLAVAGLAEAQGFRWPEEPENLKALPASVKGRELGSIMRGFASALDVRCQYCHVAQAGLELDPMDLMTFDFASDENPRKNKARTMLRMVGAINDDHLSKLGVTASDRVRVDCVTCHRGQSRPEMLGDVLATTIAEDGVEAAIEKYRELRESHYGGFSYDFSPGVLGSLGESLLSEGEVEVAIRMLALENEQNPDFAYGHYLSGMAHDEAGHGPEAIQHMEKAVALAPDGQKPFFQRSLEKLKNDER